MSPHPPNTTTTDTERTGAPTYRHGGTAQSTQFADMTDGPVHNMVMFIMYFDRVLGE